MALEQYQKYVARRRYEVNHQDSVVDDFKKRISLDVDSLQAFEWIEGYRVDEDNLSIGSQNERFGLYLMSKAIDVNSMRLPSTSTMVQKTGEGNDNNNHSQLLDFSGDTLLHWACRSGKFMAVKLLLSMGADKDAVNDRGLKPHDVICTRVLYVDSIHRNLRQVEKYDDYPLSTLLQAMTSVEQKTKTDEEKEEETTDCCKKKDNLRTYMSCQYHYYEKYLLILLCFESDDEFIQRIGPVIEAEEQEKEEEKRKYYGMMMQASKKKNKKQKKQKLNS